MSTTYTATAAREGRWWVVTVPAVSGVTQARRLAEVADAAAELVAVTLDVPTSEVEIDLHVATIAGVDVEGELDTIRQARAQAKDLEVEASRLAGGLARTLADAGVPLRDIGVILGVSHQRAHQIVTGAQSGN